MTYEHETFKLADRTTYTPDWNVLRADGIKEQHEVKGGVWLGDSRVKFKVAAKMYPEYIWKAYVYKGKRSPGSGGTVRPLYFNEKDPYAAQWLRNLYPTAQVDERSIVDVSGDDVPDESNSHFFAGIAGWQLALELASWPTAAA